MTRNTTLGILGAALITLFAGCASNERRVDQVPVATSPTDNPAEQIQSLEAQIQKARERNANILSPTWFSSAEKSLKRAREVRDEGGDFKEIFRHIAEGRAQIQRSEEFTTASEKLLPEVMQARAEAYDAERKAREAGATNLDDLRGDYKKVDERFFDLAVAVEDNDIKKVEKNRGEVIQAYRILATRSLKKQKLDTARRLLDEAQRVGAEDYAPRSFQVAKQAYDSAEKFINTSPNVGDAVDAKANESVFYANRALVLTKEAKGISDAKPEEVALTTESYLVAFGNTLGLADRRDRSFADQAMILKTAALERNKGVAQNAKLRSTLEEVSQEAEQSRDEADKLQARETLFKDTSSRFTQNEAEVIRRGDSIILRLKGIHFPVGEARLGPENFALLGKVKDALEEYPNAQITVEGHTDASGSAQLNSKLSRGRAEAVREYLASSGAVTEGKISAVGLGSTRPIETNKTPEGRSANRRIDIVIVADAAHPQGK